MINRINIISLLGCFFATGYIYVKNDIKKPNMVNLTMYVFCFSLKSRKTKQTR